ncbi:MAG TPA: YbfB/YjiJ family MFS transporter [Candidatus Sulfotelmatobacter sp.]|nr:YbfB/YjiJ family MFS transporter [Candidatus Sulfotelmatobacter sp.]
MSNRPFLAGALVLAVAMGVGRFAYTPLLAIMRVDAGLTVSMAGVLASINLAGYLVGAALGMLPLLRTHRRAYVIAAPILVALLTAAMALGPAVWPTARFVTGVASGVSFVLVTSLLLDYLHGRASTYGAAILFSGVGIGIAGSGALVAAFARLGGSSAAWLGTGVVSLLLLIAFVRWLPADSSPPAPDASAGRGGLGAPFVWLSIAYGIEGAAYVIPATFLVVLIRQTPAIAGLADAAWIVVGLVAIPSMAFVAMATRRFGAPRALIVATAVQALTFLGPILLPGALGVAVIAVGLGGTFIVITALSTAIGRSMAPHRSNFVVGLMTVIYGAGQVAGPLLATWISLTTGSYRPALVDASIALVAGTVALIVGIGRTAPA